MCCVTLRQTRLTRGPCFPDTVRCSYSDWARPLMTRTSPWSSRIGEGTDLGASTHLELHRIAYTHTDYELGRILWAGVTVQVHSRWHLPLVHHGDKKGATLHHKPITPSQMALLVCGLTAAPRPYAYEHRQSCPGVTQAVSYDPRWLHRTLQWSRLAGSIRVTRIGSQEPPGGWKVSPRSSWTTSYLVLVAVRVRAPQPAPPTGRLVEN